LKDDAGDDEKKVEVTERQRDIREVINYRNAMREGVDMIDNDLPLAENNVKKLHKILLTSVRGKNRAPGLFRREQVYIAPERTPIEEARYVPPAPRDIARLYGNFDRYLNSDDLERDCLVQLAISHYQFEAVHPFKDGNGRMGRLLIPLFLYQRKAIAKPMLVVSKYFEEHRRDYYDLLADVSYKDAWIPWIRFFLLGLTQQAQEATSLGRRIIKLRDGYRKQLNSFNSAYAHDLLDAIFDLPYFTPTRLLKISRIKNRQTLLNLIGKFEEAGILEDLEPNRQRDKMYRFTPLINVLDGRDT
jgi:Fic family protein